MSASLAMISGEVSGDVVGAALAREIRSLRPDVALWGVGSRRMAAEGVDLLYDSSHWSAIGYVEALRIYPKLRLSMYPHVLRELSERKPSGVILIDFGAFNMKVARWCHSHAVPVLYYFPPGSWRRQGRPQDELARIATRIATPFPWSAERLEAAGAQVEFVGHPLLESVHPALDRITFIERFGLSPEQPVVGLLPGSRGFEIEHNMPAMVGAARILQRDLPGVQFVVGSASDEARRQIEAALLRALDAEEEVRNRGGSALDRGQALKSEPLLVTPEGVLLSADRDPVAAFDARLRRQAHPLPLVIAEGITYDVMAHSDALIVCSGTATLEAAILGAPMVIVYRGSRLMEVEYRLRRLNRIEHIGLPNIIAGDRIVPELIQHEATPNRLAAEVIRLLRDPEARAEVKEGLKRVRESLGTPGASARTARMALEMTGKIPALAGQESDGRPQDKEP